MNENEFISLLQTRAREQETLLSRIPLPNVFFRVSTWLGKHPWRILVPLAFIVSVIFQLMGKEAYTDLILQIFRWL